MSLINARSADMNKSLFSFLISLALLAGTAGAHAQGKQIYTWTDENGVVHYVDTPPDNPNAVSMEAPEAYRPGSSDAPATDDDSDETPDEATPEEVAPSYADQKREEMAAKTAERRAAQAERDANCGRARKQLETLEPSRRVYFINENGEEERVDDEVRAQRVEELKAYIAENCE
jgi:hypothetical protein